MSSDSSDEENIELLREAQDNQFINDSMFSDKKEILPIPEEKLLLPSLRKAKDEDEQYNLFRVTPEFRKYVAKQLSAILDDQLKYKKKFSTHLHTACKPLTSGIRLLSDSDDYLEIIKECSVNGSNKISLISKRPNLLRKRKVEISEDNLREITVSGKAILGQEGTQYWSNRSKAPIFEYKKLKNGQLVSTGPVV